VYRDDPVARTKYQDNVGKGCPCGTVVLRTDILMGAATTRTIKRLEQP
jgi:hypothetical protein